VGENVDRSRTVLKQLLTAKNEKGEDDMCIGDCRVWTEGQKGEKWIFNP